VEAYEYPEGSNLPAPFGGEAKDDQYHPLPKTGDKIPRDRVIILEDTDNNGEADKRTIFVEGLNLASAILCGDNGIYIGQQPHLIHFRDDNGDDQPDEVGAHAANASPGCGRAGAGATWPAVAARHSPRSANPRFPAAEREDLLHGHSPSVLYT
jgi:hypothetical protein